MYNRYLKCIFLILAAGVLFSCGRKPGEDFPEGGRAINIPRVSDTPRLPESGVQGSNDLSLKLFAKAYAAKEPGLYDVPGEYDVENMLISTINCLLTAGIQCTELRDDKKVEYWEGVTPTRNYNDFFRAVLDYLETDPQINSRFHLANVVMSGNWATEFPEKVKSDLKDTYRTSFIDYDTILPPGKRPGDIWGKTNSLEMMDTIPHRRPKGLAPLSLEHYYVGISCLKGGINGRKVLNYKGKDYSAYTLMVDESPLQVSFLAPDSGHDLGDIVGSLDAGTWDLIRKGAPKDIPMVIPDISTYYICYNYYSAIIDDDFLSYYNTYTSYQSKNKYDQFFLLFPSLPSAIDLKGCSTGSGSSGEAVSLSDGTPFVYIISDSKSGLILSMGTHSGN